MTKEILLEYAIPSRTVREYLIENNCELSVAQLAQMVFLNTTISFATKVRVLNDTIFEESQTEKDKKAVDAFRSVLNMRASFLEDRMPDVVEEATTIEVYYNATVEANGKYRTDFMSVKNAGWGKQLISRLKARSMQSDVHHIDVRFIFKDGKTSCSVYFLNGVIWDIWSDHLVMSDHIAMLNVEGFSLPVIFRNDDVVQVIPRPIYDYGDLPYITRINDRDFMKRFSVSNTYCGSIYDYACNVDGIRGFGFRCEMTRLNKVDWAIDPDHPYDI